MSITTLGFAGLEKLLNQYLDLDPEARRQLAPLYGRVIELELVGPELRLYLLPAPDGIKVLARFEGEPDCSLRGSPFALARMNDRRASTQQLFSGDVSISGDTETAHQFGKALAAIEVDWEEQLSKLTGDVLAHKIGNIFRATADWGGHARRTLAMDVTEYLEEELRLLPGRSEVQDYLDGVDRLRDDVERLQARMALLRDRSEGKA